MISATVAPLRRWRMSITWLSRRESPAGALALVELDVASDLLGISVAAMGNRLRVRNAGPRWCVEKSTLRAENSTVAPVGQEGSCIGLENQVAVERIAEVEARSAGVRKELGLIDLVLMQILYVVGSSWVGTAAKLGSSHTVFWLLAIALYYLPQAWVVIYLSRLMPVEGGVYQWTTIALGKFAGFMVAWNLWAYAVLIIATFGVTIATNASYLLTGGTASLSQLWWYTPIVSTLSLLFVTGISVLGLGIGRWVQDVGGVAQVLTFAALLIVPLVAFGHGRPLSYHPLDVSVPALTPYSLNIFGKMALGALSGFEYVAIMAGGARRSARTIGRAAFFAAPCITILFIL